MSTALIALNALLATCRAYSMGLVFDTTNSSLNDWQVLDAAGTEYALVVETGTTDEGDDLDHRGSHGMYQEVHRPRVYIAKKNGTGASGYAATINDLQATVEGMKDYIRIHNRLGNTGVISSALTVRTSEVLDVLRKGQGSPSHQMQRIEVKVYCEDDLPANEGGY